MGEKRIPGRESRRAPRPRTVAFEIETEFGLDSGRFDDAELAHITRFEGVSQCKLDGVRLVVTISPPDDVTSPRVFGGMCERTVSAVRNYLYQQLRVAELEKAQELAEFERTHR